MQTQNISRGDAFNSVKKLNEFANGQHRSGGQKVKKHDEIASLIRANTEQSPSNRGATVNFAANMESLHKLLSNQGVGNVGYLKHLQKLAIATQGEQGIKSLIIDGLSNIIGKLAISDTGKASLDNSAAVASGVIKHLLQNFPQQMSAMGLGSVASDQVADGTVRSLQDFLKNVATPGNDAEKLKLARDWTRFERPHKTGTEDSMVAPRGARNDRHNHDFNGYGGKFDSKHEAFVSLNSVGQYSKDQNVNTTTVMPIPHSLSTDPRYDTSQQKQREIEGQWSTKKDHVIPYYEDRISATEHGAGEKRFVSEFASFDRHLFNQINNAPDQERLKASATGIEVKNTPEALAANATHAKAVAASMTAAKLAAGEKNILIEFGEITGNKNAVPQDMVSKNGRQAFIDGTHAVLSGVYEHAYRGALEALAAHHQSHGDVSDVSIQVRTVYHNDADPVVPDTDRQTVAVADINRALLAIDQDIGNFAPIPADLENKGVKVEFVLQDAHLMGAAVADVNQHNRAPVLQEAITEHRNNAQNLRVVVDTSWLTASARATTRGIAHHLNNSDNEKLQALSAVITKADETANAGFMTLNGAERAAQQRFFAGNPGNNPQLTHELGLLRAGQRKANVTFHSVLGEIHSRLQDKDTIQALNHHVKSLNADGLVDDGNYIGMFYQLAESHTGGLQDKTPFVWGSDNLIPAHSVSGDLKVDMYTSQHGAMEVALHNLSESPHIAEEDRAIYKQIYADFRLGTPNDRQFLETDASKHISVETEGFRGDTNQKSIHPDPDHLRYAPESIQSPFRGKGTNLKPEAEQ